MLKILRFRGFELRVRPKGVRSVAVEELPGIMVSGEVFLIGHPWFGSLGFYEYDNDHLQGQMSLSGFRRLTTDEVEVSDNAFRGFAKELRPLLIDRIDDKADCDRCLIDISGRPVLCCVYFHKDTARVPEMASELRRLVRVKLLLEGDPLMTVH